MFSEDLFANLSKQNQSHHEETYPYARSQRRNRRCHSTVTGSRLPRGHSRLPKPHSRLHQGPQLPRAPMRLGQLRKLHKSAELLQQARTLPEALPEALREIISPPTSNPCFASALRAITRLPTPASQAPFGR